MTNMKKNIFFLFTGIILLSCSNEDKLSDKAQDPEGLVFEISAKTQMDDTKIGAPVYSQDASQSVTRVSIYAFKSDGTDYFYQKTYDVGGWVAGSTFKRFTALEGDELPEGDYRFLVVGRDAADLYQINPSTLTSSTKVADITASITLLDDAYEIFAGTADAKVYPEGARVNLTMTRKVAGVLGYFKNVPRLLDGRVVGYLRLTASGGNTVVNLASGSSAPSSISYDIFNIDLRSQSVVDDIYTGNDLSSAGIVKLPNSQLAGGYMVPVTQITFLLGLYDESGLVIKTWAVNEGTNSNLDILPNHFYSLGTKYKPNTTTGTDPGTGDDDDAIDLLQDQTITITIDPAWSTIHQLTIE